MTTKKKYSLDFQIYQIYYDNKSGANLDKGFTSYFNEGETKTFENGVMLDVWINKRNEWIDKDYVGVLSWRFFEKTHIKSDELFKEVALSNESVYAIIPKGGIEKNAHAYSREQYKPVMDLCKLVDKAKIFKFNLRHYLFAFFA